MIATFSRWVSSVPGMPGILSAPGVMAAPAGPPLLDA